MSENTHRPNDKSEIENHVADLLERRAERLVVEPDLDGLLARQGVTLLASPATGPNAHRSRRRLLLATAAALLVIAGVGVVARYRGDANTDVATSSLVGSATERGPLEGFMAGGAAAADEHDLVIWMDPDASQAGIAAVADLLTTSDAVDRFTYVDTAATYDDFRAYYADEPEVLDLVEPEMLPTSFLVETSTPEQLAFDLADQPDVSGLDFG